jgi:hypothetical protein
MPLMFELSDGVTMDTDMIGQDHLGRYVGNLEIYHDL